jgi:hypothetical protein
MPTINRTELELLLRNVKGTTLAGVVILTVPQVNKKVNGVANPIHGRVQKRAHRNVVLGFKYENSVNNQRIREDKDADFVAEPRAWGVRIDGTPLVSHNDNLYLECKVERVVEAQYLLDGQPVEDSEVEPYLPVRKPSSRQEVDRPVVLIDVKLENVEQLRIFGEVYNVVGDAVSVADVA